MPLNPDIISNRIIQKLDIIGINSRIGGRLSHTSNLVKIIVEEIVKAIQLEGEVITTVNTTGTAAAQTGIGRGKMT
ncbi:MAG: hypothetical protein ACFFG0_18955 [Candidatus Thorarchaeota archaeon]